MPEGRDRREVQGEWLRAEYAARERHGVAHRHVHLYPLWVDAAGEPVI